MGSGDSILSLFLYTVLTPISFQDKFIKNLHLCEYNEVVIGPECPLIDSIITEDKIMRLYQSYLLSIKLLPSNLEEIESNIFSCYSKSNSPTLFLPHLNTQVELNDENDWVFHFIFLG